VFLGNNGCQKSKLLRAWTSIFEPMSDRALGSPLKFNFSVITALPPALFARALQP